MVIIVVWQRKVTQGEETEMEWYLEKEFDVITGKHPSEEAQKKWRKAVALVRNHRRRFRHVPDLQKRSLLQTQIRDAQVCKSGLNKAPFW